MRALAVVIALLSFDIASACPWQDRTFVLTPEAREPLQVLSVPRRPRFFVHVARNEFPRFTLQGGAPVEYTPVLVDEAQRMYRVDLDVESGLISVDDPETGWDQDQTFIIDPTLRPATLAVTKHGDGAQETFEIVSSAVLFRVDYADQTLHHSDTQMLEHPLRITALYADRREEVIYDRAPITVRRTGILLGALFLAAAALTWFVSVGPASARNQGVLTGSRA